VANPKAEEERLARLEKYKDLVIAINEQEAGKR
jgi:hypothetical protein